MQQCERLRHRLRDPLFQTLSGHLHQQFGDALLCRQVEIMAQYLGEDKLVVQPIGLRQGAPRQEHLFQLTVFHLCHGRWHFILRHIDIKRNGLWAIGQVWISTQIDDTVQPRLIGIERDLKLGVIDLPRHSI